MKESENMKPFKNLRSTLRPMSHRERLEHIWTYYRTDFIILMVFIILFACFLTARLTKKEILLGGLYVNVQLNEAGKDYTETAFFNLESGNSKRQMIDNYTVGLTKIQDDSHLEENYYTLSAIAARVGAPQIDYFLADQIAMETFLTQGMYMDLREFFSEEELLAYQDRLVFFATADENGVLTEEKYPVAINISDTEFAHECLQTSSEVFFSVAVNTRNIERTKRFWDYLLAK